MENLNCPCCAGEHQLQQPPAQVADLKVDFCRRRVVRGDRIIPLRRMEFEVLGTLIRAPEHVFSRRELLERVWGEDSGGDKIDVYICQLRTKIDRHFTKKLIHTFRGVGYSLREA